MTYHICNNPYTGVAESIRRVFDDGTVLILPISDNGTEEYKKYLEWVAEGNTPEPADSE